MQGSERAYSMIIPWPKNPGDRSTAQSHLLAAWCPKAGNSYNISSKSRSSGCKSIVGISRSSELLGDIEIRSYHHSSCNGASDETKYLSLLNEFKDAWIRSTIWTSYMDAWSSWEHKNARNRFSLGFSPSSVGSGCSAWASVFKAYRLVSVLNDIIGTPAFTYRRRMFLLAAF